METSFDQFLLLLQRLGVALINILNSPVLLIILLLSVQKNIGVSSLLYETGDTIFVSKLSNKFQKLEVGGAGL